MNLVRLFKTSKLNSMFSFYCDIYAHVFGLNMYVYIYIYIYIYIYVYIYAHIDFSFEIFRMNACLFSLVGGEIMSAFLWNLFPNLSLVSDDKEFCIINTSTCPIENDENNDKNENKTSSKC